MLQAKSYYLPAESDTYPVQGRDVKKLYEVKKNYKTKTVYNKRSIVIKSGMIFFLFAVLLVFLCIKSATLGYQINSLEKDIANLETENKRLGYSISQKTSLARIERIAMSELGMNKSNVSNGIAVAAVNNKVNNVSVEEKDINDSNSTISKKPLKKVYDNLVTLAKK